jgi:uncharacterized protein YggE
MNLNRVVLIAMLLPFAASAQEARRIPPVVRATGEATVTAKPDQAHISIGVNNQAPTAEAASSQNATETSQVLDAIKRTLGTKGEVKTAGYSVSPNYTYPKDGAPPKIAGYNASNTVSITVNDLSLVGKLIDTATQAGANNISGISFTLRDDTAVRAQALGEAAAKARANAEAIAKALNLDVVGVLDAQASEAAPIRPLNMEAAPRMLAMAKAPTPVETGSLDVHASVIVTLEVKR